MEFGTDALEIDPEKIFTHIEPYGVYENRQWVVRQPFAELTGSYKLRLVLSQNLLDHDRLNVYHIEVLHRNGSVPKKGILYIDFLEWPGWSQNSTRRACGVLMQDWESDN